MDEVSLANTEMIIYTAPNGEDLYMSIWVNEQATLNLVLSEFNTLGLRFDKVSNFTSLSLCDNLSINQKNKFMENLQIFRSEQFGEIRTLGTPDQPLFCLVDVCKAVELKNPSSVKARLDKEDVQLVDLHALKPTEGRVGNSRTNFITESALYDVILLSCSPRVKPFRKWVTSEVLPAIRKHGAYMTSEVIEKAITEPDFLIRLATNLKEERQKRMIAEQKANDLQIEVKEMKDKVSYLDIILASKSSVLVTQIAQDYGESPVKFNKRLQEMKIQFKRGKQWILYADYMACGYVTSETYSFKRKDGTEDVRMNTKWTQKGRKFLYDTLKSVGIVPMIERA